MPTVKSVADAVPGCGNWMVARVTRVAVIRRGAHRERWHG